MGVSALMVVQVLAQAWVWLLHVAARRSCVKNGSQTPADAPFLGQCLAANTVQTAHLKLSKISYHPAMPEQCFRVDSLLQLHTLSWYRIDVNEALE
jgi:hypothetical protein